MGAHDLLREINDILFIIKRLQLLFNQVFFSKMKSAPDLSIIHYVVILDRSTHSALTNHRQPTLFYNSTVKPDENVIIESLNKVRHYYLHSIKSHWIESHVMNTTGVDVTVTCLLTSPLLQGCQPGFEL